MVALSVHQVLSSLLSFSFLQAVSSFFFFGFLIFDFAQVSHFANCNDLQCTVHIPPRLHSTVNVLTVLGPVSSPTTSLKSAAFLVSSSVNWDPLPPLMAALLMFLAMLDIITAHAWLRIVSYSSPASQLPKRSRNVTVDDLVCFAPNSDKEV